MTPKQRLGNFGEELARRYLKKHGYKVLEQHYGTRFGEIDLIAHDKKGLVFIEVKTRTSRNFGLPEEAITQGKQERILLAAQSYLLEKSFSEQNCRIDSIAVEINQAKRRAKIRHFQNITAI